MADNLHKPRLVPIQILFFESSEKTIEVPEALSKPEYKRNKREQKLVETYLEQLDIRYRKSWNKIFEDN